MTSLPSLFKPALRSRRALILAASIVVVAGVGGTLLYMTNSNSGSASKSSAPSTPKAKYTAVDSSAQKLLDQGKYDEAAKALEKYLATNPPKTEEARVYVKQASGTLGAAYLNGKDYDQAIVSYRRALDYSTDPYERMSALHSMAVANEMAGNTQKAIESYKAVVTIAQTLPASDGLAARYILKEQRAIIRLGGTS